MDRRHDISPKADRAPRAMSLSFPTALFTLAVLAAYLITGALTNYRISPPIFFTLSLGLIATSFRPNLPAALISIALCVAADVTLAIDHIVSA